MIKSDIIKEFNLSKNQINKYSDVFIDLESNWAEYDSYKIQIGETIREIDFYKVSKNGNVMFIDNKTKQITILNASLGQTDFSLQYNGHVLYHFSSNRDFCSLKELNNELVFELKIKSKRKNIHICESFPNNEANLKTLTDRIHEDKKKIGFK